MAEAYPSFPLSEMAVTSFVFVQDHDDVDLHLSACDVVCFLQLYVTTLDSLVAPQERHGNFLLMAVQCPLLLSHLEGFADAMPEFDEMAWWGVSRGFVF